MFVQGQRSAMFYWQCSSKVVAMFLRLDAFSKRFLILVSSSVAMMAEAVNVLTVSDEADYLEEFYREVTEAYIYVLSSIVGTILSAIINRFYNSYYMKP